MTPNRSLQFHKRSQLFTGTHNETLSVAMRVHNPDRSPIVVEGKLANLRCFPANCPLMEAEIDCKL
jgi:hypothetical protein